MEEARYTEFLGDKVCPVILGSWYIGEKSAGMALQYLPMNRMLLSPLLVKVRNLLEILVWPRPCMQPHSLSWPERLSERLGIEVPDWIEREQPCLIHGDPTLANIVDLGGHLRILDPKPPGRGIPSLRSVDRGKMIQSLMGWELALGAEDLRLLTDKLLWPFADLDDENLSRAIWWCMIHFLRIVQREGDTELGRWSSGAADELGGLLGLQHRI